MNGLNENIVSGEQSHPLVQLTLLEAPVVSELDDFVELSLKIAESYPEILTRIEADQIAVGLEKKKARLEDQRYIDGLSDDLPHFSIEDGSTGNPEGALSLHEGRPRMPALLLLVFYFLRGWIKGPKAEVFRILVPESRTLMNLYDNLNVNAPGLSTIADNINTVSNDTAQFCLRCQLDYAKVNNLDDFTTARADSTAVHANSVYPTESTLIKDFLQRAETGFYNLKKSELCDLTTRAPFLQAGKWIKEVELCSQIICMVSGKVGATEKRKHNYKKIYSRVERIRKKLTALIEPAENKLQDAEILPSKRKKITALIEQIKSDIKSAETIAFHSAKRILHGLTIPTCDKILSTSDGSAAIIKKGDRDLVFGYRPQLAFSGMGLVTVACVPEGNAADSGQIEYLVGKVESNTGIIPSIFTVDDGYVNGPVRDYFLQRAREHGIENPVYSIAGAKGKKVLGEEVFYSPEYKAARSDRSAAESCISTLKCSYDYGDVKRRGIEAVRQEQLSKVLAYNLRKLIVLERSKRQVTAKQIAAEVSQEKQVA